MKNLILSLTFVLTFSCNTSTEKPSSTEQPTQEIASEQPVTEELDTTPKFNREPLDSLEGTTWIHQPYPKHPDCIDTLRISMNNGFDWHCEIEIKYDLQFGIENDTLFTELYHYKSEVDLTLGKELQTKCKLIKSDGKLIVVHRAFKAGDKFEPVEEKYLYQEYSKL